MRLHLWLLISAFGIGAPFAQDVVSADPWHPPEDLTQISLWPASPPDSKPAEGPEDEFGKKDSGKNKVWHFVANVVRPTITVFPPKVKNTGAAMIVFPGGGYKVLAIDLEGTEICDWLTSKGITCVLLKYRVPNSGCNWDEKAKVHRTPKAFTALQDAQRAVGLVRSSAAQWGVDPTKIGVMGFSAGGNLVAMISTRHKRNYPSVDKADEVSCRPDFAVALYPGHLSMTHKNHPSGDSQLNTDIKVTSNVPPTFLLHAQNDETNPVEYSLLYYAALRKANVPVEMHLFAQGGHAFGLRPTELPISKWPSLVETWLRTIKVIEK